ncbi:MAG: class I SAM-dependent methyltransferase family protein [Thermoplasmata archaeon]
MCNEEHLVVKVKKERAEETMKRVKEQGSLDPTRVPKESGEFLLIPVEEGGEPVLEELEKRVPRKSPFQKITERLDIPEDMLPTRWEMVGNVLLFKLSRKLLDKKESIAEVYAEILGADTVLLQGPIEGVTRRPEVEVVYGDDTETVHVENGIKYMLDAAEIMFSSGNIDERRRMASVVKDKEVVVDMFAGIGYFTLPMAVHGMPKEIHALEINPIAYEYLCKNIYLNGVEDVVSAHLGDNREFFLEKSADRVIMGYLHETWKFLPKAIELLDEEGMIHYHCNVKGEKPEKKIKRLLSKETSNFELLKTKRIKSYAPHVYHMVADVQIG